MYLRIRIVTATIQIKLFQALQHPLFTVLRRQIDILLLIILYSKNMRNKLTALVTVEKL